MNIAVSLPLKYICEVWHSHAVVKLWVCVVFKTFNAQFTCDVIKMSSELTICIQKQNARENQHGHRNLTDL